MSRARGTRRIIYIVSGTILLFLGAIGVFVPILPTTPFWLLTCWFYLRSSDRLYARAMGNRYFGSYVRGFLVDKAIPMRSKAVSIFLVWLSTVLTSFFIAGYLWLKVLLTLISIGVTWHISSYPTKRE